MSSKNVAAKDLFTVVDSINYEDQEFSPNIFESMKLYSYEMKSLEEFFKDDYKDNLIENLQESILHKRPIEISMAGTFHKVFPHKLLNIEGELSIICEGLTERILFPLEVSLIEKANFNNKETVNSSYKEYDVTRFIQNLRSMSQKEERIILKIYDPQKFKTDRTFEYFMKPCLVITPRGEYIWGATIERSPAFYEWLYEVSPYVEIIDPNIIKLEFLNYCQKKDRLKA